MSAPKDKHSDGMIDGPKIQILPIQSIKPYARNSRTHSEDQIRMIADSIEAFGMVGSIVVRDGVVAKGHGTLQAIQLIYQKGGRIYPPPGKAAGAKPYEENCVPVLNISGWTDAQYKAYVIADNKLGQESGWNDDMLRAEFEDLADLKFDLDLTGFNLDEISKVFDETKGVKIEECIDDDPIDEIIIRFPPDKKIDVINAVGKSISDIVGVTIWCDNEQV